MMERLFRYSLDHTRQIRMMWQDEDGTMRQSNVQVLSYDQTQVTCMVTRPKHEETIPLERVLAVDFRKGDDGTP